MTPDKTEGALLREPLLACTPSEDASMSKDDVHDDEQASSSSAITTASTSSRPQRKLSAMTHMNVKIVDMNVALAGSVGYLAMGGPNLHGYLAAFRAIRPLVVKILMLNPCKAYSAFKVYSRLQRLCQSPYLPSLENGQVLNPWASPVDRQLTHKLRRYLVFAVSAYPASTLASHDCIEARQKLKGGLEAYAKRFYPKSVLLLKREKAGALKPAYILLAHPPTKEIILAIQGTHSRSDWVTDLVCNPSSQSGQHLGMKKAAIHLDAEIRDVITEFLSQNGKDSWQMVLTGHSLGGGVATLLAIRWINLLPAKHRNQVTAYSFGAPCVCSPTESLRYIGQIYSIIFGRDLVSRLSFGAVRHLLICLHSMTSVYRSKGDTTLANIHNATQERLQDPDEDFQRNGKTNDDDDDDDALSNTSTASDDSIRLLDDEDDTAQPLLDEVDWESMSTASYDPSMSGKDRRALVRQDLGNAVLTLPVPFKELRRLVRQRSRELDAATNCSRVEPKTLSIWKRLFDCYRAPPAEDLTTDVLEREMLMMQDALQRISNCHRSPQVEMMIPAGTALLIIPKLHFLVAKQEHPVRLNEGQCVIMKYEGKSLVDIVSEPVWHSDALRDHSLNCYLMGLAPEQLARLPRHVAVLPHALAKTRDKRANSEVFATQMTLVPKSTRSSSVFAPST